MTAISFWISGLSVMQSLTGLIVEEDFQTNLAEKLLISSTDGLESDKKKINILNCAITGLGRRGGMRQT